MNAHTSTGRLVSIVVACCVVAAACGGGGNGDVAAPAEGAETRTISHDRGETVVPADPERLAVLGEEFLLANVLALGIKPSVTTLSLERATGLDDYDLTDIVAVVSTETNVEFLASMEPDMVLAPEFVVEMVGYDTLSAIAPTVPIADQGWRESSLFVADSLGRRDRMVELLDAYDAKVDEAQSLLGTDDGRRPVSLASIYPGPQLAFWIDGPTTFPQTALDIGLDLIPSSDTFESTGAAAGRAFVSLEVVSELQAPDLFLIQSTLVEGERAAYEELAGSLTFADLPAVASERVHVIDRLGFPGVEGRTRLIDELVAALDPTG